MRGRVGMLVGLVLVAVACVPAAPDPLSPSPSPVGLRVMTYNLLGAQADDAVFSEWAGWAARVDQQQPDVLVVQEAQADDIGAIALRSHGYRIASYGLWACDAKGNPEGVGILVREDIAVLAAGARSLGSSCQDPSMRRVLAWADLDLPTGPLRVYGTHLTAGSGNAALSREAQIRQVRSIIASESPDGRWLLAGDVNVTPGSSGYQLLLGDGMVDTYDEADPAGLTAGWPKDDNPIGCDLLSLCTSWERRRDLPLTSRIDVVLRAAGGPVSVDDTFVPGRSDADWASPGAEWFRLSDHLPYVVDLSVA